LLANGFKILNYIQPIYTCRTLIGNHESSQYSEQSRFAGSIWTNQSKQFALSNIKRNLM